MKIIPFQCEVPVRYNADVVVIGGGLAGCASAISASRHGADVMIIEQNGMLGGMATLGHVSPLDARTTRTGAPFGGLIQEIVPRVEQMNRQYGGANHSLRNGPEFLRLVLLQMLRENHVRILFHASLVSAVIEKETKISSAIIHTKSGLEAVSARVWIDASGDGDLIAFSGESYALGSEPGVFDELVSSGMNRVHFENGSSGSYTGYQENGLMQPVSMMFTMAGVDFSKCSQLSNKLLTFRDLGIDQEEFFHLPYAGTPGFEENGDLVPLPQGRILINQSAQDNQVLVNMSRVIGINATDAKALSYAEETAQLQILYLTDFLIRYIPGFEHAWLMSSSHTLGIRETRRLIGRYVLRGSDAIECRPFPDTIAQGSYMIDIHDPQGKRKAIGGELKKSCYSIPYRCLLPCKIENLLACGRCISVDHVAHASTRIQGTCILTGQAAGTAAAMSLDADDHPAAVNVSVLQQQLQQDGIHFYPA